MQRVVRASVRARARARRASGDAAWTPSRRAVEFPRREFNFQIAPRAQDQRAALLQERERERTIPACNANFRDACRAIFLKDSFPVKHRRFSFPASLTEGASFGSETMYSPEQ